MYALVFLFSITYTAFLPSRYEGYSHSCNLASLSARSSSKELASNDRVARAIFKAKSANKNAFLAGEKKTDAVKQRKVAADKQERVKKAGTVEQMY